MGLFSKKKTDIPIPAPRAHELLSLMETMTEHGLHGAIEQAMQKQINNASLFQAYADSDQGNYFGQEFNIMATAQRIKSTYISEPWIYATATLIARTLAALDFIVVDANNEEVLPDHPLNAKLNLGNRIEGGISVHWKGYLDLILAGNFFLVFDKNFREAYYIPAEQVAVDVDEDLKLVKSIKHFPSGAGEPTVIPIKQCVHFKYPNPYSMFYGMSMFIAASRPLLLDRYKNEFEMAFYLRGATNAGVIETTEDINQTRMERLMRTFEAVYTGKRNWWRTIFLPKGATWKSSGLTMTEMQHLEGLRENRLTILSVLGIPPSQVGIIQDVNRSTSEVQERAFWINTIKPLGDFIASAWNSSYLVSNIYGGAVKVIPNYSNIEALQGSLITKGEQAKSVENYLLIDEIREDILGYDPLPLGKGQIFVSEVRGQHAGFDFALSAENLKPEPVELSVVQVVKSNVVGAQERAERRLTKSFLEGLKKYSEKLLDIAQRAVLSGEDLARKLLASEGELAAVYSDEVKSVLEDALHRGFVFANANVKHVRGNAVRKNLIFDAVDIEAIEVLMAMTTTGQRAILARRMLMHFAGFNRTSSNKILDIVASGLSEGLTTEQVAASIRGLFGEFYKSQAFTIARTEILTALSQGIKWNQEVLGEVFTKVQKQWLHVGDSATNPDARDWHAGFEDLGVVNVDYVYDGGLSYPRDPNAPPEETINCRCSLVSVIPSDAESNAEVILDRI